MKYYFSILLSTALFYMGAISPYSVYFKKKNTNLPSYKVVMTQPTPLDCAKLFQVIDALKDFSIRGKLINHIPANADSLILFDTDTWESTISLTGQIEAIITHLFLGIAGNRDIAKFVFLSTNSKEEAENKFVELKQQLKACKPGGWFENEIRSESDNNYYISLTEKGTKEKMMVTIMKYDSDKIDQYSVALKVEVRYY